MNDRDDSLRVDNPLIGMREIGRQDSMLDFLWFRLHASLTRLREAWNRRRDWSRAM